MKNLFVLIAAFFGAFITSALATVVFALYNLNTVKLICLIMAAVFFTAFFVVVLIGFISSAKSKNRQKSSDEVSDEKPAEIS